MIGDDQQNINKRIITSQPPLSQLVFLNDENINIVVWSSAKRKWNDTLREKRQNAIMTRQCARLSFRQRMKVIAFTVARCLSSFPTSWWSAHAVTFDYDGIYYEARTYNEIHVASIKQNVMSQNRATKNGPSPTSSVLNSMHSIIHVKARLRCGRNYVLKS